MKIVTHQRLCVASGNCGFVAPKVFANPPKRDGFVKLLDANPPASEWAAVRQAEYLCPLVRSRLTELQPYLPTFVVNGTVAQEHRQHPGALVWELVSSYSAWVTV